MIGLWQWMPAALICLALSAWAWRLRLRGTAEGQSHLETLATAPLGPSQRVVAVRAAGRVYLLAVTPQGVSTLGEMDAADWGSADEAHTPGSSATCGQGVGA
jgi:flagellar biogenesis protein FliO